MALRMSKPTVAELNKYLKDMTKWQQFALHLPRIKPANIDMIKSNNKHDDIEDEKIALYHKWLSVYPSASWADVIKALEDAQEIAIAANLKKQFPAIAATSRGSLLQKTAASQAKKEPAVVDPKFAETEGINAKVGDIHHHDQLNIVVVGTTGAGKSTLINSLLGAKQAVENGSTTPVNYPEGIKSCSGSIDGVQVRCFDTNGFFGDEETLKSVVQGLKSFGVEPDLFLVCINITDIRFIPAKFASELSHLSQLYGVEKFWEKVIIAFTFTNRFELQQREDIPNITNEDLSIALNRKAREICEVFQDELVTKSNTVSTTVFNKIQACFVGRKRIGFHDDVKLVTSDDWWKELLLACAQLRSTSPDRLKVLSIWQRAYSNLSFKTVVAGGLVATAFVVSRFF